jgi:seryl-tRNA synthetase
MLDIKFIIEHRDHVAHNAKLRGFDIDVDRIVTLDADRRRLIVELDSVRAAAKRLSRSQRGKPSEEDRAQARRVREDERRLSAEIESVNAELQRLLSYVPNMLDPRVPVGDDDAYTVLRHVGEPPSFDFEPKPHDELGRNLGIIDFEHAVNTAGSRFYNLVNEGVLLRMALTRMFLDQVKGQGFTLVSPPCLAKDRTMFIAGYLPFAERDNFRVEGQDLSLIGTSEQSLLGMHADEILPKLPLMYLGDSMCFRTEAGSYGRDVKGMLRVHQFYKLEQLVYAHPDDTERMHLLCLDNEEQFMKDLSVPYRVIICSSADMAAPGSFKYDTEAWLPSQQRYREMTSNTNLTDYQTRRGNIRYKGPDGTRVFPHTISATGFADRLIAAIVENHQRPDGSVRIPDKLVPYMGGLTELTPSG